MSATLPELIEQLSSRAFDPRVLVALTEIDRRLTALEERTAPPFSGNEVTANLLRAAEEARAKAVEDGLAMLEKREPGSFGDYPSLQAYLAANKALVGAVDKHITGAESEPVTAGQGAAALVMLGPELRAEERKQRAAMQEATDAGRVDVISSSFSAAREWPTELARALSEAVDGLKRSVRIAEETGEHRIAGFVRPVLFVVSGLADDAARGGSST